MSKVVTLRGLDRDVAFARVGRAPFDANCPRVDRGVLGLVSKVKRLVLNEKERMCVPRREVSRGRS